MPTASVTNSFTASTTIASAEVNTNFSDLVTFLNTHVTFLDGTSAMSGDLAMGSNKITGLAEPVASTDAATKNHAETWSQAVVDIDGLAVTDGNIIVADGANWVAESGQTARTSLGASRIELCAPASREYDTTTTFTAGSPITVTLGATVGGVTMSGATGVMCNFTVVDDGVPTKGNLKVWDPDDSEPSTSWLNYGQFSASGTVANAGIVGINSSRQLKFQPNTANLSRVIIDVTAVLF